MKKVWITNVTVDSIIDFESANKQTNKEKDAMLTASPYSNPNTKINPNPNPNPDPKPNLSFIVLAKLLEFELQNGKITRFKEPLDYREHP